MDLNNTIPYNELHNTSTQSEKESYVSGKVESGDMFSVIVLAVIVIFILIFIIYKIINFVYIRKSIDKIK